MDLGTAVKKSLRKPGWEICCIIKNKCRPRRHLPVTTVIIILIMVILCDIMYEGALYPHSTPPLYHSPYQGNRLNLYRHEITPTTDSYDDINGTSVRRKVLLMTYMRGGSSLLGEMFNQNPEAVYWFEPFDGVFSGLYGSRHGWFPIDLLYDDNNRLRLFTDYEEDALLMLLNDLMNCNIDSLPTDTIAHYAMTHILQKRFSNYTDCLISINQGNHKAVKTFNKIHGKLSPPWECKAKLIKYVPRHFSSADKILQTSWYCLHVHPSSPYRDMNASLYLDGGKFEPYCDDRATAYEQYAQCMDNYRQVIKVCTPLLEEECRSSSLVGMKGIRLRADLAQRMLIESPDLKLVYQIRDPRGIVLSRRQTGLLSTISDKNLTKEALLLCQRIAYDLSIIYNMQKQFPERILSIKYEDLVLNPGKTTELFYEFINMEVPPEVTSYVTEGVTSSEPGNAYSTTRRNGTNNAFKWKAILSEADIKSMTNVCRDVLEHFSYPTSVT